ncbi:MAG: hypothetical protein GXY85_12730 [Candidatus Brocadiaceae bacterium]|nr:hypothetical protein [Candidatus Brocadiaceae bacterium]
MTGRHRPPAIRAALLALAVVSIAPAAADPILDAAFRTAQSLSDPYARCRSILTAARGFADAGLTDRALEAVAAAERASAETPLARQALLETAETCARSGLHARAAEIAAAMAYLPDAVHVHCLSARELLESADTAGALRALDAARLRAAEMTAPGDAARALVRIADVYSLAGRPADWEAAIRAAAEAARAADSPLARAVLLEWAADACLAASRPDAALTIARTVEDAQSRAPLLVRIAAGTDDPAEADRILTEALAAAGTLADPHNRAMAALTVADAAARPQVADAARAEALRALPAIADELRAASVRDRLAPLLAAAGRPDEAIALLTQTPDPRRRNEQMLRLALAHSEAGRYAEAVRCAGELDAETLRTAGPAGPDGLALAFARAWGEPPNPARIDGLRPDALRDAVLSQYARDLSGRGECDAALDLTQAIGDAIRRDAALLAVGRAALTSATSGTALAPARRALERIAGLPERLMLSTALAGRMVALGRTEEARGTLAAVAARSAELPPAVRSEVLGEAALTFDRLGDRRAAHDAAVGAVAAALDVSCASCRDDVIGDLFGQMSGPDYADLALAAAGQVRSPGVRAANLLRMIQLGGGLGEDQAERLLRSALPAAIGAESPTNRVDYLVRIAEHYRRAGLEVTPAERQALRRAAPAPAAGPTTARLHPHPESAPGAVRLVYFDRPGCPECLRVKALFEDLRRLHPDVAIEAFDLGLSESAAVLNAAICEGLGVPREQRFVAPSVFSSRGGLVGSEITLSALSELAHDGRGLPSPIEAFGQPDDGRAVIEETYGDLGVVLIVSAALADGFNPCAFTVIIFFLSYLAHVGRGRRQIVQVGAVYTAAVFVTYLGIGVALLGAAQAADAWSGPIHAVMAALALTAAALSLRDGVRCLRGHATDLTLSLPEGIRSRIRLTISRRTRMGLTLAATATLGAVVALLEFPCTGWVYLPIVIALRHMPQARWGAFGWLVLYNVIFILPLVVVFTAVVFGLTSERLTALFRRHLALTKFGLAAVFAGLAAYLVTQAMG